MVPDIVTKQRRTIEVDPQDREAVAFYKSGAVDYVAKLPEWARYYLYTKPFCTIEGLPEAIHILYLHDFARDGLMCLI
jgi:hypothetical protein